MSHKNMLSVSFKKLKVTLLPKSDKGVDDQGALHSHLPSPTVAQAEVTAPLKCILSMSLRTIHVFFWEEAILAFPYFHQHFLAISCQIKELGYTNYNQIFAIIDRIPQPENTE